MPNVDINKKRGYEAKVPIEKFWEKLENGTIDKNFCIPLGENAKKEDKFTNLNDSLNILAVGGYPSGVGMFRRVALVTLLKFNKPEDVKFILIDPLKIYFFHFKKIDKYLLSPIITDNKTAFRVLKWVLKEHENRYKILVENKFRTIEQYNEKHPGLKYPKIVIIITELGELIDFNKNAEEMIVRIIQMTKAVGIHFLITSQRPTDKVLTPLIKANIFTKIAFRSGSEEGSMAILGRKGAEDLLGQGDMIVESFDKSERMQGYYLPVGKEEEMMF